MPEPYLLHNLRVEVGYSQKQLFGALARHLGVPKKSLGELQILSEGLDSRKRPTQVLSVAFRCDCPLDLPTYTPTPSFSFPEGELSDRGLSPVIVGAGPAGLTCALLLALAGAPPLLLDQGGPVLSRRRAYTAFLRTRHYTTAGSLLWGEGGAGTFSDGKLTTRRRDPLLQGLFQILTEAGAPPEIHYKKYPHLGSDGLQRVIPNITKKIQELGGIVQWDTALIGLARRKGQGTLLVTTQGEVVGDPLILATGGSSHGLLPHLLELGVTLSSRPLQLGLRMEQPREVVNRALYGRWHGLKELPTAAYNFTLGRCHTFCMCPGGEVVCASGEEGRLLVNGMSAKRRMGEYSNTALILSLDAGEWSQALALRSAIEEQAFQIGGGNYSAPAQTISQFLRGEVGALPKTSYRFGVTPAPLHTLFPEAVTEGLRGALVALHTKLPGVREGLLIAPETRVTPPYRLERKSSGEVLPGLYFVGEGSGYASGIVTSALDGMRVALGIIKSS